MTHDEAAAAPTTPKMGPTGDDYTRTVWRDRGAQIARLLAENAALTRECLDREATEADLRSRLAVAEAEVERLRGQVERARQSARRAEQGKSLAEARAEAAEAKLRDVEALADGWATGEREIALEWNVPIGETFANDLRAVLARSQAPQTPAEQELEAWCHCGHLAEHHLNGFDCQRGDPGAGWDCECTRFAPIVSPSVRPATADDEDSARAALEHARQCPQCTASPVGRTQK